MAIIIKDLLKQMLNKLLPSVGGNISIGLDIGPDRLNLVQMQKGVAHPFIRAITLHFAIEIRDEKFKQINPSDLIVGYQLKLASSSITK